MDLSILQCPLTRQPIRMASLYEIAEANKKIPDLLDPLEMGVANEEGNWFYPIWKNIYHLHSFYSIPLLNNIAAGKSMEFDKQRIFNYFNQLSFHDFEGRQIYNDDDAFVDFRPLLLPYTQHGFYNCRQYLDKKGKYYVDAACGPVAYKEYIQLAEDFDYRICIDLSVNALLQAQQNLSLAKQSGIFICGDLTALPLQDGIADAVLCQHALFHVQKKLQAKVIQELTRVAAPGKKIAIVYDWFYHSMFMNIALGPYQLYRIIRHWAGKGYARIFRKDKLYFYAYPYSWFVKNNPGKKIECYCWRSVNIHFTRFYIHASLGGKKLIDRIWKMEKENPKRMGRLGEYPIIVIEK